MTNKRFFLTFFILAVVVWSSSWWLYHIFMYVVHAPGYSQSKLMEFVKTYLIWPLGLGYIIFQAILLKKKNANHWSITAKVFLGIMCLYFVYRFAFRPQVSQPQQLDIIFVFGLALLSGFINRASFGSLLLAWFCIIFINEMVIQGLFLPYRSGAISDIFNNMVGVSIGLMLSMKWFWKK